MHELKLGSWEDHTGLLKCPLQCLAWEWQSNQTKAECRRNESCQKPVSHRTPSQPEKWGRPSPWLHPSHPTLHFQHCGLESKLERSERVNCNFPKQSCFCFCIFFIKVSNSSCFYQAVYPCWQMQGCQFQPLDFSWCHFFQLPWLFLWARLVNTMQAHPAPSTRRMPLACRASLFSPVQTSWILHEYWGHQDCWNATRLLSIWPFRKAFSILKSLQTYNVLINKIIDSNLQFLPWQFYNSWSSQEFQPPEWLLSHGNGVQKMTIVLWGKEENSLRGQKTIPSNRPNWPAFTEHCPLSKRASPVKVCGRAWIALSKTPQV